MSTLTYFNADIANYTDTHKLSQINIYTDYSQCIISSAVPIVTGIDTIQQSLDNLFHARKHGRRYMYYYYVPMDELIGELYGTAGTSEILDRIKYFVELNESRVQCYPSLSQLFIEHDLNRFQLSLVLDVPTLANDTKFVYSLNNSINSGEYS